MYDDQKFYFKIWSITLLQFLLNQILKSVRRVKLEVRPLFLPQLMHLVALLQPGLHSLSWTDRKWNEFVKNTSDAIRDFDVLVTR